MCDPGYGRQVGLQARLPAVQRGHQQGVGAHAVAQGGRSSVGDLNSAVEHDQAAGEQVSLLQVALGDDADLAPGLSGSPDDVNARDTDA